MSVYNSIGTAVNSALNVMGIQNDSVFASDGAMVKLKDVVDYDTYSVSQWCECPVDYMQGFAIYDGMIFQFRASTSMGIDDLMCVIDSSTGEMVSRDIPSVSGHGDSASFSKEFASSSDKYPLLLVTADTSPAKVYINKVTESASQLVRTLKFPVDKAGYYSAHAYDAETNVIYMVGYTEDTFIHNNPMVVSKWDMNNLSQNEDDTYTPAFVSSCTRPYIFVTQGQTYHDGMIWIASGYPSQYNSYVYAIDPNDGRTVHSYDLGTKDEVEGVDFISDNELIVGLYGGNYIKYTFAVSN